MSATRVLTDVNDAVGWKLDHSYARLPAILFSDALPARVREPRVVIFNHRLANVMGLDFQSMPPGGVSSTFAGQELPTGARPIAQAYAGHQYRHLTMLGDGRAILLGEQRTPDERLVDVQF